MAALFAVVLAVVASMMIVLSPKAMADAGEILGTRSPGAGYSGPYKLSEDNPLPVWCADFGKAEPMANGGVKYSDPQKIEGVSQADLNVVIYALQEGQRAIDEGNDALAGAVASVIHASGINAGASFDPAVVPDESRADFDRIRNQAPEAPNGSWLTARVPDGWTAGGKDGYQRVLDYDQVKTGVLEVDKVDSGTGDRLAGAEFTIVDEDNKPVVEGSRETRSDRPYRVQVDAGKYRVIEGKAPKGYTLNGDGSDKDNSEVATVESGGSATVTFANTPLTQMTIRKVDDQGAMLPGAKIRVTGEGQKVDFTSKDEPHVIQVKPGHYTVTEVQAPEGYIRETSPLQVDAEAGDKPVVEIVNSTPEVHTRTIAPEVTTEETTVPETTTPETTTEETTTPETTTEAPKPVPEIGTLAHIDNNNVLTNGGKVIDQVSYKGLTPGEEYTLNASMQCLANNETTGNTGTVTFTPESESGVQDVEIPVTDDECQVQVVFEELLNGGEKVAEHKDMANTDQTVGTQPQPKKKRIIIQHIPSGPTTGVHGDIRP